MSSALAAVLLAVGALSTIATLRLRGGADADQVRGFCLVGAAGAFVVAVAVLGIGLLWDTRIADSVAIIALFGLVVFHLAALAISYGPRRRRRTATPAATMPAVPAPTSPNRTAFRPVR